MPTDPPIVTPEQEHEQTMRDLQTDREIKDHIERKYFPSKEDTDRADRMWGIKPH